jgi:hypothetical protein
MEFQVIRFPWFAFGSEGVVTMRSTVVKWYGGYEEFEHTSIEEDIYGLALAFFKKRFTLTPLLIYAHLHQCRSKVFTVNFSEERICAPSYSLRDVAYDEDPHPKGQPGEFVFKGGVIVDASESVTLIDLMEVFAENVARADHVPTTKLLQTGVF